MMKKQNSEIQQYAHDRRELALRQRMRVESELSTYEDQKEEMVKELTKKISCENELCMCKNLC